VGLSLLATVCTCSPGRPNTIAPLTIAQINPAPIWQLWGQRALDCAQTFAKRADVVTYTILHDSVDVSRFVWLVVATERPDGGFPCRIGGKPGYCAGQFRAPDSILISVQRLEYRVVIAHEILHWAIDNPLEAEAEHGAPWGLCDYF
jgi:hypothetical protein